MNTPIPSEALYTPVARVWRDPMGIVRGTYIAATETVADAQANMAAVRALSNGERALLLIDSRALTAMIPAVRAYYVSEEAAQDIKALAILVGATASRFMGNLFLRFQRTPLPTKLFTDDALALRWLQLHQHSSS